MKMKCLCEIADQGKCVKLYFLGGGALSGGSSHHQPPKQDDHDLNLS